MTRGQWSLVLCYSYFHLPCHIFEAGLEGELQANIFGNAINSKSASAGNKRETQPVQLVHLLNKLTILRLRPVFQLMRLWDGRKGKRTSCTGWEKATRDTQPRWALSPLPRGWTVAHRGVWGSRSLRTEHIWNMRRKSRGCQKANGLTEHGEDTARCRSSQELTQRCSCPILPT